MRLHDDRAGEYSIRINLKWWNCFRSNQDGPSAVKIVDHHCKFVTIMSMKHGLIPVHPSENFREEIEVLNLDLSIILRWAPEIDPTDY